jgi:polyferredoxin
VYIVGIGARFALYLNALNNGDMTATKPFGVEGFLPISALLGLKQLVMSFEYDRVHPAGLTIFIAIIVMSIVLKKSFCSHICPVGCVSESVSKIGFNKRIPWYIPVWALKYVLLGFFVYVVLFGMDINAIRAFINSPYNAVSDAKMLYLFTPPSLTTVLVLVAIILLTLVFRNFWCKNLCPYGALLGLFSVLSPIKVKRNAEACTSCMKCTKVCPSGLSVHTKKTIHNPDCVGCHECIKHRGTPECLETTVVRYNKWFPLVAVGIFVLITIVAMVTGYWESSVSNEQYLQFLKIGVTHP